MEYEIVAVEAYKDSKMVTPILNGSTNNRATEISRMVVEISFRRKIQYHVANTFLQVRYELYSIDFVKRTRIWIQVKFSVVSHSLKLLIVAFYFIQTLLIYSVGFLVFFFELDNFSDRIMVLLTTMLVIAITMQSIQGVSICPQIHFLLYEFVGF